jgi:hypothetical protein
MKALKRLEAAKLCTRALKLFLGYNFLFLISLASSVFTRQYFIAHFGGK